MAAFRHLTRLSKPLCLSVLPSSCLVDTNMVIKATGLEANSCVTIRSFLKHQTRSGAVNFEGHAHYIADDRGVVSVPDQTSLGGTYTGAESMGLFWSMQPSPGQRLGVRFLARNATKPVLVNLSLYRGHLDTKALQTAEPEATTTAERWYMGENVERIPVRSGRLRGVLYKPKGPGPFPGVIDMFGNAGGLVELRAAMLASHGLACYALPYLMYEDLPTTPSGLEVEYFKEAIDWLTSQPFVEIGGIGIVAVSMGAQCALVTTSNYPEKIGAVVSINGCHVNCLRIKLNREELPYIPFEFDKLRPSTIAGATVLSGGFEELSKVTGDHQAVYKLENARDCQFLFVAGESDAIWDSIHYAQEAIQRLRRHECHNYRLLSYPDAGHLIEVPYVPMPHTFLTPGYGVVENGGSTLGNALAMEDSWPRIVKFLHAHCGRPTHSSNL